MRRLVNAYGAHIARLLDGDTWDNVRAFTEMVIILGGMVLVALVVIFELIYVLAGPSADHGSCRVQHWTGKVYVCDEYYPPPTTQP